MKQLVKIALRENEFKGGGEIIAGSPKTVLKSFARQCFANSLPLAMQFSKKTLQTSCASRVKHYKKINRVDPRHGLNHTGGPSSNRTCRFPAGHLQEFISEHSQVGRNWLDQLIRRKWLASRTPLAWPIYRPAGFFAGRTGSISRLGATALFVSPSGDS